MSRPNPLVEVDGLKKHYPITEGILKKQVGTVRAVDGISFDIDRGETVGLVGESGCGKSTAATSLLRLEEPTDGAVWFDGEDVTEYDDQELKAFRRRAQMIFQDPSSSFDPRMSIAESVAEPLRIHGMSDKSRRRAIVEDLLERVGLSARDADRYPHEFSGGQKQRIAVARALSVNPEFIVADEPVSALDVSIQAEILSLLEDIQDEFDLSFLLISHDMGVVRQVCDRVNVMYLGQIVESGPTEEVFDDPQHPYTQALMSSIPQPDPRKRGMGVELTGSVPNPSNPPEGCRFHTRCPLVIPPEDIDLEQSVWRRVMDFRSRADREGIEADVVVESHLDVEDPGETGYDREQVDAAIREEFELPETLADADAESAVSEAVDQLTAGDGDAAAATLREAFPTVCANEEPAMQDDGRRRVACHLQDERYAATMDDQLQVSGSADD
ncbi:ABC transporter ATP-binding protein [Halosegnis sp.]|uniref:ABC transporter ATP-binding protein n=1 Tax=Halosegnis sp. TaxID=2864959 RepID=UPI0035D4DD2C